MDFDLLYYHKENEKSRDIAEKLKDKTWDEALELMKSNTPNSLIVPLGDEDALLDFFIEYVDNHYNLSKEYDKNFYEVFYNETSKTLYKSFRDFVLNYSNNNLNDTIYFGEGQAFLKFRMDDSYFLRSRASHYSLYGSVNDKSGDISSGVMAALQPKNTNVITEKFLIVNKNSNIDKRLLAEVATYLTSKEMQQIRADRIGTVPSFDFTKKDTDEQIAYYCQTKSFICSAKEKIKQIRIRSIFMSEYSPNFFEIRIILPSRIRYLLKDWNYLDKMITAFKNVKNVATSESTGIIVALYIFNSLVSLGILFTVYLVFKYRSHSYIKVISPYFSIIICIGFAINNISLLDGYMPLYSILECDIGTIVASIVMNLILLPMLIVTYRIYRIIKSKTILNKKLLDNKHLMAYFFIIIIVATIYKLIFVLSNETYILSYGFIDTLRIPYCFRNNYEIFEILDYAYVGTI
eukprot:jgi/Orpsp1_1/1180001/evm.model.c7180000071747.1